MARFTLPRRNLLRLAGASVIGAPAAASAAAVGATAPVEGQSVAPKTGPTPWSQWFDIQRIWGYADRTSLLPGEPLNVMLAGGPGQPVRQVHLEVFRIGADQAQTLVWKSDPVSVSYLPATRSASAMGPDWPPAIAAIDTRA